MPGFRWIDKGLLVAQVDGIVEQAAAEGATKAKEYAPVDTGALRNSITYRRERADTSRVTWLIGTNIFYAPFQEFGTRYIPARAFMGRALAWLRGRYG